MSVALLFSNVAVFALMVLLRGENPTAWYVLAFNPADLAAGKNLSSLLTSMFLHISDMHILFNMIFMIFWAPTLESRIGPRLLGVVYLLTGLAGTLTYAVVHWGDATLLLGASGALMGIAGVMVAMYPQERITFFLFFIPLRNVRLSTALALMLAAESLLAIYNPGSGIAHEAHLGGVIAGLALGSMFSRAGVGSTRGMTGRDGRSVAGDGGARGSGRHVSVHPSDLERTAHLLRGMAVTEAQREAVREFERNLDEPDIAALWLDRFLEEARCPRCGAPLSHPDTSGMPLKRKISIARGLGCGCGWKVERDTE